MSALLAAGVSRGGEPVALCLRRADGVGLGLRRRRRVFAAGARCCGALSATRSVLLVSRRRRGSQRPRYGSSGLALGLQGMQVSTSPHQASLTNPARLITSMNASP